MIDYEIALCDVAEVMRRHNKAQLGGCVLSSDVAVMRIRNIVTPHAHWIKNPHSLRNIAQCSLCDDVVIEPKNYCPNCGAKMIKEDPENVSR